MRRRDLLVGLAGAATVGGAALTLRDRGGDAISPVTVETIDAPGSEAGETVIPERGRVTLVEFFATWCHVCAESMESLGEAYDAIGDDVQFVSVTNEPVGHAVSRAEIREWWVEHDGRWPVALDQDLQLTEAFEVSGVPTVVVLDANNVVTWTATGKKSADELRERVADARDAGGD